MHKLSILQLKSAFNLSLGKHNYTKENIRHTNLFFTKEVYEKLTKGM